MSLRNLSRPLRQARSGKRFNSSTPSSSSSSSRNPQVQKAMEGAQKAFNQSAATVQRMAGPVGERVGSALGGEQGVTLGESG